MRVLITGVAGFIGSHLADRFLAEGNEVWGIDNLETGRESNYPAFVRGNVANGLPLGSLALEARPELVVHCAASYSDPHAWHRDTDTNVTGTINAALVAKQHGARIVYFQTALPPVSSYAISKLAGEQYLRLAGPSLVFRLANIYGPRNLSGPIPTFYKRLTAGEACTVVETTRDLVYVDDLVECVFQALAQEQQGTFDVCSGTPTTIASLYAEVAALVRPDAPEPLTATHEDVLPVVDPGKGLPGWEATTPLSAGIRQAVEWYREHGVGETYSHLKLQ